MGKLAIVDSLMMLAQLQFQSKSFRYPFGPGVSLKQFTSKDIASWKRQHPEQDKLLYFTCFSGTVSVVVCAVFPMAGQLLAGR